MTTVKVSIQVPFQFRTQLFVPYLPSVSLTHPIAASLSASTILVKTMSCLREGLIIPDLGMLGDSTSPIFLVLRLLALLGCLCRLGCISRMGPMLLLLASGVGRVAGWLEIRLYLPLERKSGISIE
jgi:hypothetical protein